MNDISKKVITTHQNPDLDAIGSIWLLQRFDKSNYDNSSVTFVPAGEKISLKQLKDLKLDITQITHVDTGGSEFDDHANNTGNSSAVLVFNYLKRQNPSLVEDKALGKVVGFIDKTDHFESYFWPEPTHDRYYFMLEHILNGYKLGGYGDDHDLVRLGITCLDGAYTIIKIYLEAEEEIKKGTIFNTKHGQALAVECSNDAVIKLAQKMGYTIVVRKDPELGNLRIKAAPLPQIDLTPVWAKIQKRDTIGSWYFHPGKHMLINGSKKNTDQKPSPLTLTEATEIIKTTLK